MVVCCELLFSVKALFPLFVAQIVVQFIPTVRQTDFPQQVEGYCDAAQGYSESDAVGHMLALPIEITVFHQFYFVAV